MALPAAATSRSDDGRSVRSSGSAGPEAWNTRRDCRWVRGHRSRSDSGSAFPGIARVRAGSPQSIEANTLPPQTHAIALDATDELSVERAFQGVEREFGVLDALINLPGFANRTMPVADMASEE